MGLGMPDPGGEANLPIAECLLSVWFIKVLTRYLPYTEIENEMQVLLLICGDHNTRKTPEPSSPPSLPSVFFDLMRECWEFDASRRPDSQRCMENVKNILQASFAFHIQVMHLPSV